jgi:hypothetical protein
MDPLDRFDFNDQPAIHQEIDSLMTQKMAAISDRHDLFFLQWDPLLLQLDATRSRVDAFVHSGARARGEPRGGSLQSGE